MKERSTGLVNGGYPVAEATLYIYCDRCGSFNLKIYIPVYKLLIIIMLITTVVLLAQVDLRWLLSLIPLGLLALFLPWKDMLLKYKCRKCGNIHITDYNSLHYEAYNVNVVDVPDHLAQKRYIDTDVSHFQQFT